MLGRLKFELDDLVDEILNQLPDHIWTTDGLRFADIQMAGGQFIQGVVRKLRENGFSDDNIRRRVFGFSENEFYLSYVRGKFDIIGTFDIYNEEKVKNMKKFDVVLGNPPYNSGSGTSNGNTIWQIFSTNVINNILKDDGYLLFVHPPQWRKPQTESSRFKEVSDLMFSKQIHYLEMHDTDDGLKTFGAGTRYDVYLLQNCDVYKPTHINDEERIDIEVDLRRYQFLPNSNFELFNNITSNDMNETIECILSYDYEPRTSHVSNKKTEIYKFPLVHSTPKTGVRWKYSSLNDRGHFGIPKIIFGDSGINDVIIDMNGDYGMTQHAMAIKVDDVDYAENVKTALTSDKFSKFLQSLSWSNYGIDWRMFNYFKKDFWKEFI